MKKVLALCNFHLLQFENTLSIDQMKFMKMKIFYFSYLLGSYYHT